MNSFAQGTNPTSVPTTGTGNPTVAGPMQKPSGYTSILSQRMGGGLGGFGPMQSGYGGFGGMPFNVSGYGGMNAGLGNYGGMGGFGGFNPMMGGFGGYGGMGGFGGFGGYGFNPMMGMGLGSFGGFGGFNPMMGGGYGNYGGFQPEPSYGGQFTGGAMPDGPHGGYDLNGRRMGGVNPPRGIIPSEPIPDPNDNFTVSTQALIPATKDGVSGYYTDGSMRNFVPYSEIPNRGATSGTILPTSDDATISDETGQYDPNRGATSGTILPALDDTAIYGEMGQYNPPNLMGRMYGGLGGFGRYGGYGGYGGFGGFNPYMRDRSQMIPIGQRDPNSMSPITSYMDPASGRILTAY